MVKHLDESKANGWFVRSRNSAGLSLSSFKLPARIHIPEKFRS